MENSTIKSSQSGNIYALYDSSLLPSFSTKQLSADYWQEQQAIIGTAQGRGTTYFIKHQQHQWVLRHYYRGGLIGKFNKDLYFFSTLEHTRAFKEFNLLKLMRGLDLPVPDPVACRVVKSGCLYRADLLTTRIEESQDLVAILENGALNNATWGNIGKVIKRFHQHGIYHHDLNAHNILLSDDGIISVIDFDRGEQRANNNKQWQQANIARLLRSFNKEKGKLAQFYWSDDNWQQFMQGYNNN